jgi:RNA polymerase sigma-70 factor (ECF subfamily)
MEVVDEDGQLIDETLNGDQRAFGKLVRKYQDRLFNTVNMMHMGDCGQEADDVVQEAFVQAYLKLRTFRRESRFYTWLYRIAFNLAISRRRRNRGEVSVDHHRNVSGCEPLDPAGPPGDRMQREELAGQVQQALATLSHEHRAILVLRDMEGCDYDTIADILALPVGTVRSRLHRARSQLRQQMMPMLEECLAK